MNKCPYCGFETKEGDVFCMNCGAALDEDFAAQPESRKRKKHTVLWIVLAAVIVLLGVAAVFLLTRPELILARAARNTVADLESDEALSFLGETYEHGSIEVNMELKDLISSFSIPLLDEIDARAGIKVYNNAEEGEHLVTVTGSLGGSSALGADIWISPEHLIVKSPTLIGRDAYGIDFTRKGSRREAESLLKDYLGIDIEEYDEYADAAQLSLEEKEAIKEKLLPKLYLEAFKTGTVKSETINYDFGRGSEKTQTITMSFTMEQIRTLANKLIDYAKQEDDLKDLASTVYYRWLDNMSQRFGKDFTTEIKFYISNNNRLSRVEARLSGAGMSDVVAAVQLYDGDFFAAACTEDVALGLNYAVGRNNSTDYSARIDYTYNVGDPKGVDGVSDVEELAEDGTDFSYSGECDISWDKESSKWEIYADGGFKSSGELKYDRDARVAEAVVARIRSADFTFEPDANIIIKAHDEMPSAPDYKTVSSDEDVEEFINAVTENVGSLISEFMADYMGDMAAGALGIEDVPGEADAAASAEAEAQAAAEAEAAAKEAEEAARIAEEEARKAAELAEREAVLAATASEASLSDDTYAGSIQKINEKYEHGDSASSDTSSTSASSDTSGTSASSDASSTSASSNTSGTSASSGNSAGSTEKETEAVKKPDKPLSGKYSYDDGKKFSFNLKTGEYTEHVTVEAEIKTDGTYELVYSNGLISYNDEGTYDRDADNNMTFASSTGINATGKYYDDYIEVTIPGYITAKLQKDD